MALTTKRIIALPSQTDPQEGDYLAIDNATSGTHKIPVGRIGVEVDDTLTEAGKAADAKAVGDALDEIRSQIEVTGTASGAIATFTDGADMPAKSVIVNIEPQQSGSGTPSPDNVRPISGWDSVDVIKSGVNVWDEEWENGTFDTTTGNPINTGLAVNQIRAKNLIPVVPNVSYYINAPNGIWCIFYDADMNVITPPVYNDGVIFPDGKSLLLGDEYRPASKTFTMLANARYMKFYCQNSYGNTYNHDISINYPSTDTEYHAYNPNSHTTSKSLGRTVYGGTLDVVSGELKVTHLVTDMSGLTWTVSDTNIFKTTSLVDVMVSKTSMDASDNTIMCSAYAYIGVRYESSLNDTNICRGLDNTIRVYDSRYTTTSDFVSAISGYQLVYELATPQTYTLTGQEISTLLGENNVWADSGDVEVVYVRDLNIAINNLLNSNGTRSLGMMAMSAPAKDTAEEPTDEQTEEPAEDDMR